MSKALFRPIHLSFACQLALLSGTSASAEEPSCDLECIEGYSCEMQVSGCPELPRGEEPCEPTPYPSCIAQVCSSDADCAAHMKCYDGSTPGDVRQCLPQHSFPCNADADCGSGFTCAPLNPCLDPAVPDCVPDAPEDGKLCWVTEARACQADSDCLPDWTCENNPLNAYWASTSGGSGCDIVNPPLVCMPPHASIFGHGSAGFLDWAKGIEWGYTSVPESECPEPSSPQVSYGRGGIDEQGEGPDAVIDDTAANDTATARPGAGDDAMTPVQASSTGGCSVSLSGSHGATRAAAGLGLGLLLGLAGMSAARRRGKRAD